MWYDANKKRDGVVKVVWKVDMYGGYAGAGRLYTAIGEIYNDDDGDGEVG